MSSESERVIQNFKEAIDLIMRCPDREKRRAALTVVCQSLTKALEMAYPHLREEIAEIKRKLGV